MVAFCGKLETAWVVALLACAVLRVDGHDDWWYDSWEEMYTEELFTEEMDTEELFPEEMDTEEFNLQNGMLMTSSVNYSVNSSSVAWKQNVSEVNNDNFSGHGQNCGPYRKSCLSNTNLECSSLDGSGVCVCPAGYVYVQSTESCWTVSKSGADPCNHDIQCHYGRSGNYSRCSKHTGRCECYDYLIDGKRNMVRVEGVCYVAKTRGDFCDNNEECDKPIEGEAYCKAGDYESVGGGNYRRRRDSCQCREGHIWYNALRKCLPLATQEGDACVVTQQCRESTLGSLSRCDFELDICLCAPSSGSEVGTQVVYYKDLRKCFLKKEYNSMFAGYGQYCGSKEKSCLPNTNLECSRWDGSDVCVCPAGYVYVQSIESCRSTNWKAFLVGGSCVAVILAAMTGVACLCIRKRKARSRIQNPSAKVPLAKVGSKEATDFPPNLSKLRIIDRTKLRKDKILGQGAFGTVHRGVWMPEYHVKIPVAIKELHIIAGASDSDRFMNEAFLMAGIRHENLLKMVGLSLETTGMLLVSLFMPLGSLVRYLKLNKNNIGSKSMLRWCTQIAKGMEHLETCRIIHRDLAARNVVMESPTSVKITDFGLAKLLNFGAEQYEGKREMLPIRWLAPECITDLSFSHKSDVWAFGVTVWEILTCGETPFDGIPLAEIGTRLIRGERLEQPSNCTIDLYMMLIKTWMLDPESRPSFKQLVTSYTEMYRDPGRYLFIPNDELRRLPRYTVEDEDLLIRRLVMPQDRPEDLMSIEQYARLDREGYLRPASGINQQGEPSDGARRLHYPSMYRSFEA